MNIIYKHTVTLSRPAAAGTWDDKGNYIKPSRNDTTIRCVVQPDRKKSLYQTLLPEGIYSTDYELLMTKVEVLTANDDLGTPADEIIYNGTTYVVFIANPWDSPTGNLSHYECLIIKKDKLR